MKKPNNTKLVLFALGAILLLGYLASTERPLFLGAITSFTQTGNELKFTEDMVVNGTATITRSLILQHGNVTSAYIDVFATPTITTAKVVVDSTEVLSQTEQMINVQRIDITSILKRDTCNNCIIYFKFQSDEIGSIIVSELDVTYGSNPNAEETTNSNGPDEVTNPYNTPQNQWNNTQPVTPDAQVMKTTSESAIDGQKILFYLIVITLIFLMFENGKDRGFFKSI